MTEPIALLDFSHIRCQAMSAEYIRNPAGEIPTACVSVKRCVGWPVSARLLVSFQRALDGRERFLEMGNRPAYRSLPDDRSFRTSQARLLGTHGHD